jgi:hypothetical protein
MSRAIQKGGRIGTRKYAGHVGRASTLLWLLGPACLWGQTQPARQPVGSDLFQGDQLIVKTHNFAVTTPAGAWQWSVTENPGASPFQATYVCTETASGAELSVTIIDARASSDGKFVAGFKSGLQESLTASGFKVVSLDMVESSVPLPGSYHCQWQAVYSDGTPVYGYCYVTGGAVGYVLQHTTTEASEPPTFTEFARTFHLLHPAMARAETGAGLLAAGYLLLVGFACVVAWIVNRVHGRAILNGGTLGAALVLVPMIVLVVVGNYAGLSAGATPGELGRITGQHMGEAFIPLLVAVLISRSFRKRKRREEVMPEVRGLESNG